MTDTTPSTPPPSPAPASTSFLRQYLSAFAHPLTIILGILTLTSLFLLTFRIFTPDILPANPATHLATLITVALILLFLLFLNLSRIPYTLPDTSLSATEHYEYSPVYTGLATITVLGILIPFTVIVAYSLGNPTSTPTPTPAPTFTYSDYGPDTADGYIVISVTGQSHTRTSAETGDFIFVEDTWNDSTYRSTVTPTSHLAYSSLTDTPFPIDGLIFIPCEPGDITWTFGDNTGTVTVTGDSIPCETPDDLILN